MKKKNATIDDLARMVQKGFVGVEDKVDKMATKKQVDELSGWARHRFDVIDEELKTIRKQLTGGFIATNLRILKKG